MASHMDRIKAIKEAIKEHNISELKRLATRHGFINNKLRKQVWPILLDLRCSKRKSRKRDSLKLPPKKLSLCSNASSDSMASLCSTVSSQSNHDQIEKDIARSAILFYESSSESDVPRLGSILHALFDQREDMHYIQGFNDVVSVVFAVVGSQELTRKISQKVATTFLRQYIMEGPEQLSFASMDCILQIIRRHDDALDGLLSSLESVHLLSFFVSWVLTWFAHEVESLSVIARIYDYCLCHHSAALYLSAALVLYLRGGLLAEVDDDLSLHVFLQNIEWQSIDWEPVIESAEMLQSRYPPSMWSLETEWDPTPSSLNEANLGLHRMQYLMDDIKEAASEDTDDREFRESSSSEFMSSDTANDDASDPPIHFDDGEDADRGTLRSKIHIPRAKLHLFSSIKHEIKSVPDTLSSGIGDLMSRFDLKRKAKSAEPPQSDDR